MTKELIKDNPLGTRSIARLMAKFAVPSIVAMLVNSIYNIVDQIFIGQYAGPTGNAATTLSFPFVTLSLAISLIIGAGCAANYNLRLGKGDKESAAQCVGNSLIMLGIVSVLFLTFGLLFTRPLLMLFGGSTSSAEDLIAFEYAVTYAFIIICGMPFVMCGTALSHMIRADGAPQFSMIFMLIGAILNTVLDPIFIFVFDFGIAGAAYATIISQFVSFLFALTYLFRYKHIKLQKRHFKLQFKICKFILALGISYFITQMSFFVTQLVLNNVIKTYAPIAGLSSHVPIAAIGIVMKVNQILMSVLIGIAQGSQPIIGFNYGAEKYQRVRKTYFIGVIVATAISLIGQICFLFATDGIISIFGSGDNSYFEFSRLCFRIFLGATFVSGFQVVSSNYFQAIGKPTRSAVLSLSRQIGFLVPLLLILPLSFGLNGILYAGPIADSLAAVLAGIFIVFELRKLNTLIQTTQSTTNVSQNLAMNVGSIINAEDMDTKVDAASSCSDTVD